MGPACLAEIHSQGSRPGGFVEIDFGTGVYMEFTVGVRKTQANVRAQPRNVHSRGARADCRVTTTVYYSGGRGITINN